MARPKLDFPEPNPTGICVCGCGLPTPLARYSSTKYGTIKDKPLRYVPGHQRWVHRTVPEGQRWCNGCKDPRPLTDFYRRTDTPGSDTCKECRRQAERRPDRQECRKDCKLRQRFGILIEDYRELLDRQKGVCAICKRPERQKHQSGTVKQLAVDHCHKTGKVRGLLCFACNHLLGNAEDDIGRLQAAIRYLRR